MTFFIDNNIDEKRDVGALFVFYLKDEHVYNGVGLLIMGMFGMSSSRSTLRITMEVSASRYPQCES